MHGGSNSDAYEQEEESKSEKSSEPLTHRYVKTPQKRDLRMKPNFRKSLTDSFEIDQNCDFGHMLPHN